MWKGSMYLIIHIRDENAAHNSVMILLLPLHISAYWVKNTSVDEIYWDHPTSSRTLHLQSQCWCTRQMLHYTYNVLYYMRPSSSAGRWLWNAFSVNEHVLAHRMPGYNDGTLDPYPHLIPIYPGINRLGAQYWYQPKSR